MRGLVATLGFDERPLLHACSRWRFDEAVVLGLKTDDRAWARVEQAYHRALGFIRDRVGKAKLVALELRSGEGGSVLPRLVWGVKRVIEPLVARADEVVAQLSGGPRVLVLAAYTALLGLEERLARRVKLLVEGEGFELQALEELKDLRIHELDDARRRVLRVLIEYGEPVGPTLVASRIGVAKSTACKYLRQLQEKGLVRRASENGKYIYTRKALVNA